MNGEIEPRIKEILFSKNLIGSHAAGCRITFLDKPTNNILYNIESVDISNDESQFNGSASFTIINVNPNDVTDYGYFTPYRNATLKPQNEWYQEVLPSKKIKIEMGYFDSWVGVFVGYITDITMSYEPTNATIKVNCIDTLGYFCNRQWINHTLPVEPDNIDKFYMEVPVPADYNECWLVVGSLVDPSVEDTVKELIVRAGVPQDDVILESTMLQPINTEWEKVTYADALEELKKQSQFNLFCSGDCKLHFQAKQNRNTIRTGTRTITGHDWVDPFNYQIVDDPNSITVKSEDLTTTYIRDQDYILDVFKNTIRRTELTFGDAFDSNIPSGSIISITYKNCDYIFKNGVNVFNLEYVLDHNEVYGSVYVNADAGEAWSYVADGTLWDGSFINQNVVKEIQNDSIEEEVDVQIRADREMQDMKERYMSCSIKTVGIPWLNIHDLVQIYIYGLVREIYIIKGYSLNYQNGIINADYKLYHYAYNSLV